MINKHKDNLFSVDLSDISILTGKAGIKALEQAIFEKATAMENKRINIDLIDLKYEKVLDGKAFLELRNRTLRYKAYALSLKPRDREDLSLGEEESKTEWDYFAVKDNIVAVDLILITPEDFEEYWNISISVLGRYDDINIYFKFDKKGEAIKLQQTILSWVFGDGY